MGQGRGEISLAETVVADQIREQIDRHLEEGETYEQFLEELLNTTGLRESSSGRATEVNRGQIVSTVLSLLSKQTEHRGMCMSGQGVSSIFHQQGQLIR